MGSKVIAVIPTRAGSQRILNKACVTLCEFPLFAWSVEYSLLAGFDRTIVTSNDHSTHTWCDKLGYEYVPCPDELSDGRGRAKQACINAVELIGYRADAILKVNLTNPLRSVDDLVDAKFVLEQGKDVVSVLDFPAAYFCGKAGPDGRWQPVNPPEVDGRRPPTQDLTGWGIPIEAFVGWQTKPHDNGLVPWFIPKHRMVDIDVPADLEEARVKMDYYIYQSRNPSSYRTAYERMKERTK